MNSDNCVPNVSVIQLPSLVYRLCAKHLGEDSKDVSKYCMLSFQLLEAPKAPLDECNEFYVIQKIKQKLSREFRDAESLRVEELYHKLKRSSHLCRNPMALLEFLYHMSGTTVEDLSGDSLPSLTTNGLDPLTIQPTTSLSPSSPLHSNGAINGGHIFHDIAKLLPTDDSTTINHFMSSPNRQMMTKKRPHTIHFDANNSKVIVTEQELIREILFSFQGLNGKIIQTDTSKDGKFVINSQFYIPASQQRLALRLTHMGWLFNKIQKFCNYISKEKSKGHVCQSFASALQDEILEYYRLITVIEEQMHDRRSDNNPRVTLHRLQVWSYDSFFRLKVLAALVEQCKHKTGGALASVVYHVMRHGDPNIRACLTRILNQVVLPIRRMLSQWIFHGELEDYYKEFFIATNRLGVTHASPLSSAFWHERYVIVKHHLPGFISKSQADKIVSTGKAIYLLHQVCRNEVSVHIPGYSQMKESFESSNLESLFNRKRLKNEDINDFHILLETAYKEISRTSLKILNENYRLQDHFRGLRQYMLLGQGDFVRHLMDVLSPHLNKPANKLARHAIVQLLESAIRATNAQFDDPEIVNRIDILLSNESTINDLGWDVFALTYRIDGPISTIFTNESQKAYPKLFRHLWRSKRMEYILTSIWKNLVSYMNLQKGIPRLKFAFNSIHMLLAEMIHFIRQMEYYLTFDVIECEWTHLQLQLESVPDVDCLIRAHCCFLGQVMHRALLDTEAEDIYLQYRAICDYILEFQTHVNYFLKAIDSEISARNKYESNQEMCAKVGDWGIVDVEDKDEEKRRDQFEMDTIPKTVAWMNYVTDNYRDNVHKFLVMLADHPDRELQELSARLDFNGHYRRRDKRLETSFTFASHKQRLSIDTTSKSQ
ncbi:gamma-tubulin complex component 3 homolog isoform X2 [Oppia nitens]|uniref:gamma-tubulin complex component 3 homolog isoform X2 n=1 Tax=Oppia nitens TaxID=1686743 RepID=UPI0023DB5FED|nr:gamma-tubulin complex component 3 homolog isoform X2 [Oppia nitens]